MAASVVVVPGLGIKTGLFPTPDLTNKIESTAFPVAVMLIIGSLKTVPAGT